MLTFLKLGGFWLAVKTFWKGFQPFRFSIIVIAVVLTSILK